VPIVGDLKNCLRRNLTLFLVVGDEQGIVREDVRLTRHACGALVNEPDRIVREGLGGSTARDRPAKTDHGLRLIIGECVERGREDTAAAKVAQLRAADRVAQLLLSEEDELQELHVIRLVVDQLPQELDQLGSEGLCLVNDEDNRLFIFERLDEKEVLEDVNHPFVTSMGDLDAKLLRDRTQQAEWCRIVGIGEEGGVEAVIRELLVEEPGETLLARAGIAEDGGQTLVRADDKGRLLQRHRMRGGEKEETRGRNRRERLFCEVKELQIR